MEKGRIVQQKQQFHDQFDELDAEIQELEAALQTSSESSDPSASSSSNDGANASSTSSPEVNRLQQQLVRLHYQIADLCGQYQDYKLATVYYHKVLAWLESHEAKREPSPSPKATLAHTRPDASTRHLTIEPLPITSTNNKGARDASALSPDELLLNEKVLNNLSTMYFGAGDPAQAMSYLLDAKKLIRDRSDQPITPKNKGDDERAVVIAKKKDSMTASKQLEKTLTANYALFLHAKGNIEDAINAASSVIEVKSSPHGGDDSDIEVIRAKITALSLLSSCWKAKGEDKQAMEFASKAAQLADQIQDQMLLSRTHNNLALYHLEKQEFTIALNHLLTAFRATQAISDFQQQAVVKYHIGLVISELEVSAELPHSSRTESAHQVSAGLFASLMIAEAESYAIAADSKGSPQHRLSSSKSVAVAAPTTSAKDYFIQSENLATALSEQDHGLTFLARGCRGESEYYAGEFHTAEAEFSIALQRLQEVLYPENASSSSPRTPSQAPNSMELVKIQGHLLSYLGCTQLVEGKFELAEESHQCDLEMALKHEDIHAQQRAMRNLALVYNSTQRYHEAIPLWREALEIASVLQSKCDQMMAYSGLGIAMKELRITDQRGEFKELLDMNENDPLHIFLRQRALAIELGDKNQQIIAQRHIVSVYESLDRLDIEQRLADCDTLVQLCEQYENLQYRADGYRSLANALTAQLARLSIRGARFAEAVGVLTQKRDSICAKYQQATKTLKAATAMMPKAEDSSDSSLIALKNPHTADKHTRPPISRVEMLQRK